MAKKNRIPKVRRKSRGKIPPPLQPENKPKSTDHEIANVSFRYWESSHECISNWQASESKELFEALERMCAQNWTTIKASGGRLGAKTGLGCTLIEHVAKRKKGKWPQNLDADADIYEMRVCKKKRIFGTRDGATFFLIWLDKNHALYPFKK